MDLAITSVGLICSVGHDAATSAAAIRAGLSRTTLLAHFEVLDSETHESLPLTGHAVEGISDGFSGVGRWTRMAARAVLDLVRSGSLPALDDASAWSRTAVALVTPALDSERFTYVEQCHPDRIARSYAEPLLSSLGGAIPASRASVIPAGHAGAAQVIAEASRLMPHPLERILLIAADSWLDAVSLDWAASSGGLKGREWPVGFAPGEAAAAILIERRKSTGASVAGRCAMIAGACWSGATAEEIDDVGRARALADVAASALSRSGAELPFAGDLIVDLNGEPWRARQFALALGRLQPAHLGRYRLVTPAASVGDTGAASGALALVCAARASLRGYNSGRDILILSSSDDGDVGAIVVRG
ncbi:hypothetical protein [Sorangium sp. So ce341]|uniref:hypothetical protein n=1 Tax=Sorangium sp. So ce341 TaxID=3133302 RepID=UPI003F641478